MSDVVTGIVAGVVCGAAGITYLVWRMLRNPDAPSRTAGIIMRLIDVLGVRARVRT